MQSLFGIILELEVVHFDTTKRHKLGSIALFFSKVDIQARKSCISLSTLERRLNTC